MGGERLEIQFLRGGHRGSRAGRGHAGGAQPDGAAPRPQTLAYSEGADLSWASLGWEPFEHPAGGYRTLFVQSPGGLRTAV